jgi:hypothetical protein|tara:strand:+ start:3102 stop:3230 length:129 start_codon:yes stop_codon:yes gene_type:complete
VGLAEAKLDYAVQRQSIEDRGEMDEDEKEKQGPYATLDTATL